MYKLVLISTGNRGAERINLMVNKNDLNWYISNCARDGFKVGFKKKLY